MDYEITLKPSGVTFPAPEDKSILESALASNYTLLHGCKNGRCGICRSRLISGRYVSLRELGDTVENESNDDFILTCCAKPLSDIEIEAEYFPQLEAIKPKVVSCKVSEIDYIGGDIVILKLRLPQGQRLDYLPGQYIDLIVNGNRRSYSIANSSARYNGIELNIKKIEGGLFSDFLFKEVRVNQVLRFEGPFGTFFIRDSSAPIIFLAGGTGFAPIKAMIETLFDEKVERAIYLYWGASDRAAFYSELPAKWADENDHFHYHPVCSGEKENWGGRKGLVHSAVLEDFLDLSEYEVYACGSLQMIEAAKRDFLKAGLDQTRFYSDAFVDSR